MSKNFMIMSGIAMLTAVIFWGCESSASKPSGDSDKLSGSIPATNLVNYPKAPGFTLKDLKGNEVSLSDFSGKLVFVNFWATWCPPCRAEIPGFIKMYDKYRDQGLEIVGISTDQNGKEIVKQFVNKNGVNYPVLMFDSKIISDYGGISAIPTTFIVNQKGEIVNKFVGFPGDEAFEKEIQKWLLNRS